MRQRPEAVAQHGQQLAQRRGGADLGELAGIQGAARMQPLGVGTAPATRDHDWAMTGRAGRQARRR